MKLDEMSETSISHGGLSSAGSAPRPGAVVRVAADHDGVVPGRLGEGPWSPTWRSTLQMIALSGIQRSGRMSPMESVARQP